MIKDKVYTATKALLRLRVKPLIKKAYQVSEHVIRLGKGDSKLIYAVDYIAKKTIMIPYFKNMLAEILLEEFEQHKDEINAMIIREAVRI